MCAAVGLQSMAVVQSPLPHITSTVGCTTHSIYPSTHRYQNSRLLWQWTSTVDREPLRCELAMKLDFFSQLFETRGDNCDCTYSNIHKKLCDCNELRRTIEFAPIIEKFLWGVSDLLWWHTQQWKAVLKFWAFIIRKAQLKRWYMNEHLIKKIQC